MSRKKDSMMVRFCDYPGLYSVLVTLVVSYALIHFETAIGAKIMSFSNSQIATCLFVICIVAKNVFIPSRANRFIEKKATNGDNS